MGCVARLSAAVVRVRFAPSPTGALHLGGALTAVANRAYASARAGVFLVRIDDTDPERSDAATERAILDDLAWIGVTADERPLRQSSRSEIYRQAAARLTEAGLTSEEDGALRATIAWRPTLLRADGSATYHLASVVDDGDLEISHVIRGRDHLSSTELHTELTKALGYAVPEYIHHGLLVGPDGKKLSKRDGATSVAELRDQGIPAEAVRAYLEELDVPKHDVQLDPARIERLAIDAIAALDDATLAARVGVESRMVPVVRGARTLNEARAFADQVEAVPAAPALTPEEQAAIQRLVDLRERSSERLDEATARSLLREVKAVGGSLRTVRRVLTGAQRGPELWTVLHALDRAETLARLERAVANVASSP
ncbi:MAG: glutamate--tRNA ligase [Gaiellaceae bacterium]